MWETQFQSLGGEGPLEKEMATHCSILAWRIPWTEEPGGLQSTGSQSQTRLSDFTFTFPGGHSVRPSKLLQSCPTLCDLMDCSLPGSLSMGFSRQEYWSGLPFPSPGDLPNPGIEPGSPSLEAEALTSEPPENF